MINTAHNYNFSTTFSNNKKKLSFGKITPKDTSEKHPLVIVTDSWWPYGSGVAVSTGNIAKSLTKKGFHVKIIAPQGIVDNFDEPKEKVDFSQGFDHLRSDFVYNGDLAVAFHPLKGNKNKEKMKNMLASLQPSAIYCATEWPLGQIMANTLNDKNIPYMSSYLTKWPELVQKHLSVPLFKSIVTDFFRNFHDKAPKVMVTTPSMKQELIDIGVKPGKTEDIVVIPRGVDLKLFNPDLKDNEFEFIDLHTANSASKKDGDVIIGYVGRVSREKNIEELLNLSENKDLRINNGNYKVVIVGQAATQEYLDELREQYPRAIFTGYKKGKDLASHFANMDVFAFPSRWDTFGIVQLEALSCGTPVAAHNVTGPKDIIGGKNVGYLEEDLGEAIAKTLSENQDSLRKRCRQFIETNYSWDKTADMIAENLEPINPKKLKKALRPVEKENYKERLSDL